MTLTRTAFILGHIRSHVVGEHIAPFTRRIRVGIT